MQASALAKYLQARLLVQLRQGLTRSLHEHYFTDLRYYGISSGSLSLDTVDQRLTSDVQRLCVEVTELADKLILWPGLIAYYSVQCAQISGVYGLAVIYFAFLIAVVVNAALGGMLVRVTVEQERREGDLRFWHASVRSNAEEIAFASPTPTAVLARADSLLERLLEILMRSALVRGIVLLFSQTNSYFGSMLSYVVVGIPLLFFGAADDLPPADIAALISKSSFVNMYLIYNLSQVVSLSDRWAAAAGCAFRIQGTWTIIVCVLCLCMNSLSNVIFRGFRA